MNFHVIVPFYRQHLTDELIKHFEPMDLIWHPVCDKVDIEPFKNIDKDWIKPVLCPPLKIPGETAYRKINDFIDAGDIIDDDYYGFIGDDDMYVPGFIDKIKQQTAKIIIFSASRGQLTPDDDCIYKWPPIDLIINVLDDVRVAAIDFCQMIVKGEILKKTRFGIHDICDDGHYAENLKNTWPNDIQILPEIGVNKNYFQLGRYINK
ncbi:MAG: hypothetical protein ACTSQG_00190 [Promethearchaeota archaeon]